MNINAVYANIRLALPDATRAEINKYIILALNDLNSHGLERIFTVTATLPSGEYTADPMLRTDGQEFNYYPLLKCLILPSYCQLIERAYYAGVRMAIMTDAQVIGNNVDGYGYYVTDTGEMYVSIDLIDGDEIKILGRVGGLTTIVLPDKFIPFFTNMVLSGLYSLEYKDADMYAVYSRKAIESERTAYQSHVSVTRHTTRNGRLY